MKKIVDFIGDRVVFIVWLIVWSIFTFGGVSLLVVSFIHPSWLSLLGVFIAIGLLFIANFPIIIALMHKKGTPTFKDNIKQAHDAI